MINVRKLKLVIRETDKELRSQKYKFIRDSQYAQYRALNVAMGYISSAYLKANKDIKSEEYKEAIKLLTNSNPIFNGIEVGTGIDTLSAVTRKARKDFSVSMLIKPSGAWAKRCIAVIRIISPHRTVKRSKNFLTG